MRLWVGGYTAEMDGHAAGIGLLDTVTGSSQSAVAAPGSPSWVAAHPGDLDIVYAAMEAAGTVQAFRRTGEGTLEVFGAPVAAGETVCHVAVAPDGGSLVASCWGDGAVAWIGLDAAGRPSAPRIAEAAHDPHAAVVAEGAAAFDVEALLRGHAPDDSVLPEFGSARSEAPATASEAAEGGDTAAPERRSRAHAAAFLPDGRIATTDLGFDLVRIWRPSSTGLRLDHEVVLPRGSGPRHMVVHPSGHLHVVTELSCEVFTLGPTPSGRWALIGGVQASPAAPLDDAGAELAASRDGEFLYAGLRGSDTVAVLRVRGDGSSLRPTALVEIGVRWPRHHLVATDTLLVAGQHSDDVAALPLDQRTGIPGRVRSRAAVPSPACLLPIR